MLKCGVRITSRGKVTWHMCTSIDPTHFLFCAQLHVAAADARRLGSLHLMLTTEGCLYDGRGIKCFLHSLLSFSVFDYEYASFAICGILARILVLMTKNLQSQEISTIHLKRSVCMRYYQLKNAYLNTFHTSFEVLSA